MRLSIPNTARLTYQGTAYRFLTADKEEITWQDIEHTDRLQKFTHEDMLAVIDTPKACLESDYFAEGSIDKNLSDYPVDVVDRALTRECWVMEALSRIKEGSVVRTEASLASALPMMESSVTDRLTNQQFIGRTKQAGQKFSDTIPPVASTLYRWIKRYEKGGYSAKALVPKNSLNKGRGPRFTCQEEALIARCLNDYLQTSRIKTPQIIKRTRDTFKKINIERLHEGRKAFKVPSARTLSRRIGKLDKYYVHCMRYGAKSANNKFALFDGGVTTLSPGERIEIDEWRIDLVSLITNSGINLDLSAEQKAELEHKRRWICAIIDCATRCILGFVICETPTSRDALRALELVARDKTDISKAYECEGSWGQRCGFGTIVADNGSAFISRQFSAAVTDLGSNIRYPPAGLPCLRGTIERLFRTYAFQLMPLLTGRTFSNVLEREDYPSEKLAALTDHDLTKAFMTFIVDVYHNEPHGGLGGETPANCWKRLSDERSVRTPPDVFTRTTIFGHRHARTLSGKGILIHNIDYNSNELRDLFQKRGHIKMEARINPHDLGWIAVNIDGVWREVRALQEGVSGLNLMDWMTLNQEKRGLFSQQAELSRPIIARAIDKTGKLNREAMARASVEPYDVTEAQFKQAEAQSYWGVRPSDEAEFLDPSKRVGLFDQVIEPRPETPKSPAPDPSADDHIGSDPEEGNSGFGDDLDPDAPIWEDE